MGRHAHTILLLLGVGILSLPRAAIAEDDVLEFAGGYLLGKAADIFFDELAGKPDLHALSRYLNRLEVWKPQYSNEIRTLREQIAGIRNRDEYNQRVFATIDRLEQNARDQYSQAYKLNRDTFEAYNDTTTIRGRVTRIRQSVDEQGEQISNTGENIAIVVRRGDVLELEVKWLREDFPTPKQRALDIATRGMRHFWKGEYARAASYFRSANRVYGQDCGALYFLALACRQLNESRSAVTALSQATFVESQEGMTSWCEAALHRVQGPTRLWLESSRQSK